MSDQDAIRENIHKMWAAVADSWGEHAEYTEARARPITERMLEATDPQPGQQVLELACGPGGPGLIAASLVAPEGEVLLTDVASEMIEVAGSRAARLELDNVSTRVVDIEAIDLPEDSFDVVFCRDGLMFAVDPAAAAAGINRVMRPGGHGAFAVWGPRAENPWLGSVMDAVSEQLGVPIPPPGMPGPFALDDPESFRAALEGGGFTDIEITNVPLPLRGPFDEWWERVTAIAGPLAVLLKGMDDTQRDELRERARGLTAQYETADGLDFPGISQVATVTAT